MAKKQTTPRPSGGFSLERKGPTLGGQVQTGERVGTSAVSPQRGGFTLAKKAPAVAAGPITAPLPAADAPVEGDVLPVEQDATQELDELQAQFRHPKLTDAEFKQKKAKESARLETALDSTYWVGLCFSSTADLNRFLAKVNLPVYGQFLDGYQFAEKIGLRVPETPLSKPNVNVLDMWADLALEVPPPPGALELSDEADY